MRNLKKFLALVLAMMMIFSMMVTVSAKDVSKYGDVTADDEFYEAIAVLSGMNVLEGDDSGFRPDDYITRAEMAAVLYRIYTGKVGDDGKKHAALFSDADSNFSDVKGTGSDWALGYINFDAGNGLVKGDPDGKFRPADNITGYETLAMLLRAIGYGRKGEFEGKNYTYEVAQRASLLGLTNKITDGTLGLKATRAMVAEMAFRAIQVHQVEWNQLVDYYDTENPLEGDKRPTLGQENFYLAVKYDNTDAWGHPSVKWYKDYGTKPAYATLPYEMVYSFTKTMDECDVIDDIVASHSDLDEGKVFKYYVDGVVTSPSEMSSAKDASIDEDGVGDTMGGEGVLTEIYWYENEDNGDEGYWIVERNTYLAQVIDENDPEPDKNGHDADRTIDLNVWVDSSDDKIAATPTEVKGVTDDPGTYAVGNYVRVYVNKTKTGKASITLLGLAQALIIGEFKESVSAYYPNPAHTIVTVGTKNETRNDSAKFFLNYAKDGTWVYLDDGYNNILGAVRANFKYGVIGAIVWNNTGLEGSHAEAKIYPVNELNTRDTDNYFIKKVTNLNGSKAKNAEEASINCLGHWNEVFDSVANNTALVGHLVVYSENDDDTIDIITHEYDKEGRNTAVYFADENGKSLITDADSRSGVSPYTITKTQVNILDKNKNIVGKVNNGTTFLIENEDGGFDRYVGMNNVPTTSGTSVCIKDRGNGYAELVVLTKTSDNTSKVIVAYVPNARIASGSDYDARRGTGATVHFGYNVIPLGQYGAPTKVYDLATPGSTSNTGSFWGASVNSMGAGLYEFEIDKNDVIVDIRPLAQNKTPLADWNNASSDSTNLYYANVITTATSSFLAMTAKYWQGTASANGTASPEGTTNSEVGFNIGDAVLIKMTLASDNGTEGVMDENDTFKLEKWPANKAIPANSMVLVVYEKGSTVKAMNYAKYVYIFPNEASSGSTQEEEKTTVTSGSIQVDLDTPSRGYIRVSVTESKIDVDKAVAVILAELKAEGYTVATPVLEDATGAFTFKVTKDGVQRDMIWDPSIKALNVTDGQIAIVGKTSYIVATGSLYASIGEMLGMTATSELGTYVKVTSAGENAEASYYSLGVGASDGDTIDFGYFEVSVATGEVSDSNAIASSASIGEVTAPNVTLYQKGTTAKATATVNITTFSDVVSDTSIYVCASDGVTEASYLFVTVASADLVKDGGYSTTVTFDITKCTAITAKGVQDNIKFSILLVVG